MLGESMSDLDAIMEAWIDDVQLGRGSLDDKTAREKDDLDLNDGSDGFDQHLEALGMSLEACVLGELAIQTRQVFLCAVLLGDLGHDRGKRRSESRPQEGSGHRELA